MIFLFRRRRSELRDILPTYREERRIRGVAARRSARYWFGIAIVEEVVRWCRFSVVPPWSLNMTSDSQADYREFQGGRVAYVPEAPGLYAWYYRPTSIRRDSTPATLARFLSAQTKITTHISHRYGVSVVADAVGETRIGSPGVPASEVIAGAFEVAEPFLNWFFRSNQFVHFCRPLYIGIAKNLYDRVYSQHYLSLTEYWDDSSQVSRCISANSHASVQDVMTRLDLPHSFALEARVGGISAKDLMASVLVTETMPAGIGSDAAGSDNSTRRALERLLQFLSDPIYGRR